MKFWIVFLLTVVLTGEAAQGQTQPLQKIAINYPTRTGQIWPL